MKLTLHVWRQSGAKASGGFVTYDAPDVSEHMSFLEMLDVVNESLTARGDTPVAFDHDCREGISVAVHRGEDRPSRAFAAGAGGAEPACAEHGRADGRRRLWSVHALRRMPGSVSQVDQH